MAELFAGETPILGFLLAALVGFLIGRTREEAGHIPRPGIRDFVIIALIGAISAHIGEILLTVGGLAAATAMLVVARLQHPERIGMTTELAALATFLVGYLCLTPALPFGAALGIVLAIVMAAKNPLHQFAFKTISEAEFNDTLRFLALVFVLLPVLPEGNYGPFGFFEPRKIWLFVVLISGVSFVGYFLTKFLGPGKGMLLSAVLGGMVSTTAFTAAAARAASEAPETARACARSALIANTIMPLRMLVVTGVIAPPLALAAAPALGAMALAGALVAWVLGGAGTRDGQNEAQSAFKNPFTLGPALRLGAVFTAVLLLIRAARHYFGGTGVVVTSAVGGVIDVDAVVLSLADFVARGEQAADAGVLGVLAAAAVNNVFKSALAVGGGSPAFYGRVIAGLAITTAVPFAVLLATR